MREAAVKVMRDGAGRLERARFGPVLATLAALAFVLRMALRWQHGTAGYLTEGYALTWALARGLAQGHGYAVIAGEPTGFRVPGYPLFLLVVTGGEWHPWTIVTAQALLGGLTVAATGLIARHLFGRGAGLIAAGICAVYPYFVWHDTALQETALVTCLNAWAMLVLLRLADSGALRLAVLAGVLLAGAVLVRETMLPFTLFAAVWAGWRVTAQRGRVRGALAGASMLAVLVSGLTPWLLHNHRVYGEYVLGGEFGAALYAGSSPLLFSAYPDGSVDVSRGRIFAALPPPAPAPAEAGPLWRDHWLRDAALRQIAADPLGWAARGLRKVWVAFRPLPSPLHGTAANLGYALAWVPLLMLGLAGAWQARGDWRRQGLIYAQFGVFAGITAALWAQTAHRVFLDVYLMVYVAGFIVQQLGNSPLRQPGDLCQGAASAHPN